MEPKFFFLICLMPAAVTAKFQVQTKDKELVVSVGSDVELPCTISPPSPNAVGLEVRWFHTLFHTVVYLLKDGREDRQQQRNEYRERAFLKSGPQTGNLSLSLLQVRLSDAGTYHCFVENGTAAYDDEDVVKLVVIGPGSPPLVKVSLQDSSVQISCSSSNWFPEPTVNWKRDDETLVNEEMMTSNQDTNGLFSVTNNILLKDSSEEKLFCALKHPVTGKESGVYVIVSDSMFPQLSNWLILFFVLLFLSLGAFAFVGWKFYVYSIQKDRHKQEIEYRKAVVYKESVHFDPDSAFSRLVVSPDKCVISPAEQEQDVIPSAERFDTEPCVLAESSFNSGKHYWETEIQERSGKFWSIGIAKQTVRRSGGQRECPEAGIWAIRASSDCFLALSTPPTEFFPSQRPVVVGIFLDYDEGMLAFYDKNTFQQLFRFQDETIAEEPVFPFYYVGNGITFVLKH
ncbi:butyrophilin subfamily 1 member A1 isoform X2 [Xenopus laevis]|uniref:Butyrophilin subfamily 1 member A1 isoform X2 n=1 Tax=Xenopus laevis TaxID=8355 RepID=A0A8J1LGW4_XENLA|nr:butyrophilin subfamily 1 member A1 isoform X2 [Xenopus laevis]